MRLFKAARWMAMFAMVAGIGLIMQVSEAQAQKADGYSLMIGIPVSYTISDDDETGETVPAKSPSGGRIMLNTPSNIGVGIGSYTSAFDTAGTSIDFLYAEREIKYSLLEVMYTIPVSILRFGIGLGVGTGEFTPEREEYGGGFYIDFKGSGAREWFVMVGAKLGDSFGIHAGFHALIIDVTLESNFGVASSEEFGATMSVVNASYYF